MATSTTHNLPAPSQGMGRSYITVSRLVPGQPYIITEAPVWLDATQTKLDKSHCEITIKNPRGAIGVLALNANTYRNLFDAFGADPSMWVGKRIVFRKDFVDTKMGQREAMVGREYVAPKDPVQPAEKVPEESEPF